MKIRNGHVSNSSSSSFIAWMGLVDDVDEYSNWLKNITAECKAAGGYNYVYSVGIKPELLHVIENLEVTDDNVYEALDPLFDDGLKDIYLDSNLTNEDYPFDLMPTIRRLTSDGKSIGNIQFAEYKKYYNRQVLQSKINDSNKTLVCGSITVSCSDSDFCTNDDWNLDYSIAESADFFRQRGFREIFSTFESNGLSEASYITGAGRDG